MGLWEKLRASFGTGRGAPATPTTPPAAGATAKAAESRLATTPPDPAAWQYPIRRRRRGPYKKRRRTNGASGPPAPAAPSPHYTSAASFDITGLSTAVTRARAPHDLIQQVGVVLAERRSKLGFSRTELGRLIGVSRNTMTKLELGRPGVAPATIRKVASWLAAAGGAPALSVPPPVPPTSHLAERGRAPSAAVKALRPHALALRQRLGLTQPGAAAAAGVNATSYRRFELGGLSISPMTFARLRAWVDASNPLQPASLPPSASQPASLLAIPAPTLPTPTPRLSPRELGRLGGLERSRRIRERRAAEALEPPPPTTPPPPRTTIYRCYQSRGMQVPGFSVRRGDLVRGHFYAVTPTDRGLWVIKDLGTTDPRRRQIPGRRG